MSDRILERFKEYISTIKFDAIRIGIASPDKIKALSYGEVKKIETINYRTLKPERDGLFCAKIFGPQKDWECNCGKYKRMKHRGVTCEKCGVEVIQSRVRRERMGHIKLVSPVCHIWFLKGVPSYLSLILEMTVRDIERVIYFDSYLVIEQGSSPYPKKTVLTVQEFDEYKRANPEDVMFSADMGAEAVSRVLAQLDINFELHRIQEEIKTTGSITNKLKLSRRCRILKGMLEAGIRPEWMVMRVLPVVPPDLRPLVPLEGGRFASSDLNDLYRRVLNRNIRLRRLIDLEAPEVIIKNEKRMLQESVDALIDNGRRGQAVRGANKRPLKSLSEMLRGKQGRFRQNLLGKRVDYSGRSVIVVDPELKLSQCGLPKLMALELFKPYVYAELQRRELAINLRAAKKMVSQMTAEVWEVLEYVVKDRPVLLNRAPTLHRIGIQAFYPILVEGKSIKLHPLVCLAFNADFDGDMMAVHVPLSRNTVKEAIALMISEKNIISPAHGRPLAVPTQDMVLGLYFLTKKKRNVLGENSYFPSIEYALSAYQHGTVHIQAGVSVRLEPGKSVETTMGRIIFYSMFPRELNFDMFNIAMKKKDIGKVVSKMYSICGLEKTVVTLDKIKKLGFGTATSSGISIGMGDLVIPGEKEQVVKSAFNEVEKAEDLYKKGVITNGERRSKVIQIWAKATESVANAMMDNMERLDNLASENKDGKATDFNPVFMMLDSGSKGSKQQIRQLNGMRGLMYNPSGEIIETPVLANFKEGLSVFEYFISTHGARKGLADTALKTADAGYLTRRLVDVAQEVVVVIQDCKALGFIEVSSLEEAGNVIEPLSERIYGRICVKNVKDPISGQLIISQGELIDEAAIARLKDSAVSKVCVRSPLTCGAKRGICSNCYGLDLSTGQMVNIGVAVGIIAAQSIGEPGTQLTLKTFHVGGTASGLVEVYHRDSRYEGTVQIKNIRFVKNEKNQSVVVNRRARLSLMSSDGRELETHKIEYGSLLFVEEGQEVKKGTRLFERNPYGVILSEKEGRVEFLDLVKNATFAEKFDEETGVSTKVILERKDEKRQPCITILDSAKNEICRYHLPTGANLTVLDGEMVTAGQILATLPREEKRTRDITGGLPRIVELVEARIPKDAAVLSDVDGKVAFGGIHRGQRRLTVTDASGQIYEYNIPRNKRLNVEDGEEVVAGAQLTSGSPSMHDILRIMGPDETQKYLVKEIQEVYTTQGVRIHDKHVEVIVRQMLRKVKIVDPGEADFVIGEKVDKIHLQSVNSVLVAEGKKVALSKPILMGITKASLETDSFIAAASFQETTRILSEAAVVGQVDYLRCLKSNVAIGRLIPAGTGIPEFRDKFLGDSMSELEKEACEEEELEAGLDNISLG